MIIIVEIDLYEILTVKNSEKSSPPTHQNSRILRGKLPSPPSGSGGSPPHPPPLWVEWRQMYKMMLFGT